MTCSIENTISAADMTTLKEDITYIDTVVESALDTAETPGSQTRNTLQGQLKLLGFIPPVVYQASIVFGLSDNTITIDRNGIVYAPLPSALPILTSGTWVGDDEDKFFVVQGITTNQLKLLVEISYDSIAVAIAANEIVGTQIRTQSFYAGWGATLIGPSGGASYIVVTKAAHDTVRGYSTVDEFGDHTQGSGDVLLLISETPNICQFGARKDGSGDSGANINAALVRAIPLTGPAGVYNTTLELVWGHGSRLVGEGNYSGVASTFETTGTTTIKYTGASFVNSTVCRLSAEAVGTEPVNSSTRDLQNISLTNVVIDCNDLAEIGVYCVRAFSNNNLDFITVMRSLKHAFVAMTCFNGSIRNWVAYKNHSNGITLGADLFGWSNFVCDQTNFISFMALFNGYDDTGGAVYHNVFDDVTNAGIEYGIGYFGGRGCVFTNAQSFRNGGAGIYLDPKNSPTTFDGGYIELNGRSSNSVKAWDIWFRGNAAADSWNVTFDSMHQGGGGGKQEAIRLTGTEPSREEHGPVFKRMGLIADVQADWGNYRLVDCNRNVTFSSVEPNGFGESLNGFLNLDIIGTATFDATGATIATLETQGIIDTVTYDSVGKYTVTLKTTFSSGRYGVMPSTGDNRVIGLVGSAGVNSFLLGHRDTDGTLVDSNGRITVFITGFFI